MSITGNREFIPELWGVENTPSGISMSDVSTLVNAEITKATANIIVQDGSKPMLGSFDINQNNFRFASIINVDECSAHSDFIKQRIKIYVGHYKSKISIFQTSEVRFLVY